MVWDGDGRGLRLFLYRAKTSPGLEICHFKSCLGPIYMRQYINMKWTIRVSCLYQILKAVKYRLAISGSCQDVKAKHLEMIGKKGKNATMLKKC